MAYLSISLLPSHKPPQWKLCTGGGFTWLTDIESDVSIFIDMALAIQIRGLLNQYISDHDQMAHEAFDRASADIEVDIVE